MPLGVWYVCFCVCGRVGVREKVGSLLQRKREIHKKTQVRRENQAEKVLSKGGNIEVNIPN